MAAVVRLPGVLRAHAGGNAELAVDVGSGATVRVVLDRLAVDHPGLVSRICDEQGELRRFVNLYVDEEDVRDGRGLDTDVRDGAKLLILPSVAGG